MSGTRLTTPEVQHLRAAFEWEAAKARIDYPAYLLMAVFDRACVTAATRPGRQFGPENQRPRIVHPADKEAETSHE